MTNTMPRLNASQSQQQSSSYVLGGGGDKGDLPRFERPVLKQAKSAYYTSQNSPRMPPKSSLSTGFFRGRSITNGTTNSGELPLIHSPGNNNTRDASVKRNKLKAVVSAREGGGLPDWSRTAVSPSNSFHQSPRTRTASHDVYPQHVHSPGMSASMRDDYEDCHSEEDHHVKQRRSSTNSSPHHLNSHHDHPHDQPSSSRVLRQRAPRQPNRATSGSSCQGSSPANTTAHQNTKRYYKLMPQLHSKSLPRICPHRWSLSHILQGTIILLVTFLLYDGHHKANLIASRLGQFKSEEAMLFLHLHRIEQQSIQLHEALQHLDAPQDGNNNNNNRMEAAVKDQAGEYLQDALHNKPNNTPNIDSALIQKQTQQLMQMEQELSHEVRTLQTRIQHSAVRSIVHEYGEGPVQVIWEVVVDGQPSKISILLWHDTPHAAWTWLEQISRKQWDGAQIHLENNRVLGVGSTHTSISHEARLDFIERSQQRHEAWTVGLMDTSHDTDASGNGLQIFINLQDNTEFSKHNVCIGKVFDGFDVLHKMVEQTRQMQSVAGGQAMPSPITIKTARASHLTNRETKGLI